MKHSVLLLDFDGVIRQGRYFSEIYSEEFDVEIQKLLPFLEGGGKSEADIGKANLFALSLYNLYQSEPDGFVDKYTHFLSQGGAITPAEAAALFGFDVDRVDFWSEGLKLLDGYVDDFIKLADEVSG